MATCNRLVIAARHFSTSGAAAQLIRPPLQIYGIGGRYAHALYSAASKEKKLDVVDKELTVLKNTLSSNDRLADFVNNPAVRKRDKLSVLQDYMKEQKMSELTLNFAACLSENSRLNKINLVLNAWGQIMSSHRGEVVCNIRSAKTLDSSQMKQLQEALQGFIEKNETLKVFTEVDPSLIGGVVVEVGDKYIDMSVSTKVRKMTELIEEAV